MRRLYVLGLVALAVVLLPSVAAAGGTGACFALGDVVNLPQLPSGKGEFAAICVDGVTIDECFEILFLSEEVEFEPNLTCDAIGKIPWDGSCLFDFGSTVGNACVHLYYDGDEFESEAVCKEAPGQWFDDPSACGIPTPTMPGFGMAALALLMLGAALTLLTMKGSAKTA